MHAVLFNECEFAAIGIEPGAVLVVFGKKEYHVIGQAVLGGKIFVVLAIKAPDTPVGCKPEVMFAILKHAVNIMRLDAVFVLDLAHEYFLRLACR